MIPLPIDEFPVLFSNLESYLADIAWGSRDKKIMKNEVLPRLINSFEVYGDIVQTVSFEVESADEVGAIIEKMLLEMPGKVQEYKAGKTNLINMFTGELVKRIGKRIDVKEARNCLMAALEK